MSGSYFCPDCETTDPAECLHVAQEVQMARSAWTIEPLDVTRRREDFRAALAAIVPTDTLTDVLAYEDEDRQ